MPVVHPIRDAQDAFKLLVVGQNHPCQRMDELVALLYPLQLFREPQIFNIPTKWHDAYSENHLLHV
ncbi:MAG: hypothetical protein ACRD20_05860 [Terriglobales bacterium]